MIATHSSSTGPSFQGPLAPDDSRAGHRATPDLDWLAGELHHRVGQAAAASGMSVAAICEQWVREGLEHFEDHQAAGDSDGSGRCSLRTGTRSVGPISLPVQQ
jgi:hypothetical protein